MNTTDALVHRVQAVTAGVLWSGEASAIEPLKTRKSAVFRVHGPRENRLIVKVCELTTGRVEAMIYQEILSRLPVVSPTLYAFYEDDQGAWLVMEDVGGRPFDSSSPSDRAVAARWLAELHRVTSPLVGSVPLPSRGVAYYRAVLNDAIRTIDATCRLATWPGEHRSSLDSLMRGLEVLESHWPEVEDEISGFPTTLVHAGLAGKNVHVRRTGSHEEVLAFDWEAGGWGIPVADLSTVDLNVYVGHAGRDVQVSLTDQPRWMAISSALWHVAPIPGELATLSKAYIHRLVQKFAYYQQHLSRALVELGWLRGATS